MKYSYPNTFGFFAGIMSVFNFGSLIQKPNIDSFSNGLESDMNQLLEDQQILRGDYQKVTDKIKREILK